jgi:hypothetical protein
MADVGVRYDELLCVQKRQSTWKRFFELPGRLRSLFSPTFLEPSLILLELAVKGSGAATLDSFYGYERLMSVCKDNETKRQTFSHFLQTMMRVGGNNKRSSDEAIDH